MSKNKYVLVYKQEYNVFNNYVYAIAYNQKPQVFTQVSDSDFVIFDTGLKDNCFLPFTHNESKVMQFKNKFYAWLFKIITYGKRLKIMKYEDYVLIKGLAEIDNN